MDQLWNNYVEVTPTVKEVQFILGSNNAYLFNDHIAFRSINIEGYGISKLVQPFLELGYMVMEQYYFTEKKLKAIHLEHPRNPNSPKIFISELILEECSPFLADTLQKITHQITDKTTPQDLLTYGRKWDVLYDTYKRLEQESEYAAWLYVHGYRVNHFTLNVNKLSDCNIEQLCDTLKEHGLSLNQSGKSIVKGSATLGLKQASTMADKVFVNFLDLDTPKLIPSCYVEFAERFKINNSIFNGFITQSADKIFESTNRIRA